jgi:hypothetical protein
MPPVPETLDEAHGRLRLALSILQHRHFCPDCTRHVDQAVLALLGGTVDEIRERR